MELLEFLKQIPVPILIIVIAILLLLTIVMTIQYVKMKGLEGIRIEVYQLILRAEHLYKESGQGKQKLKWVVQQARGLLPPWMQILVSENMIIKIIDKWFIAVKDLLDDGKVNNSEGE